MRVQLTDLMRAIDDLELICKKVFDVFEPLYDHDEHAMKRALAILHAHVRELNK